jgi:hypothetical protein
MKLLPKFLGPRDVSVLGAFLQGLIDLDLVLAAILLCALLLGDEVPQAIHVVVARDDVTAFIALDQDILEAGIIELFETKGEKIVAMNIDAFRKGVAFSQQSIQQTVL